MTKQCEIVAVAKGVKARSQKAVTDLYQTLQRNVFDGMARTYTPKLDDGDQYPAEYKRLEARVTPLVDQAKIHWAELIDVVATQDTGNSKAKADIEVNGETLATDVPAVTLIFLEKHLQDVRAFVQHIPTLDPTKDWEYSTDADAYMTTSERIKTRKVLKHTVVVPPTEHHPAIVEKDTIDEVEGMWKLTEFSGAIAGTTKRELVEQIDRLLDAVRVAREKANATEIEQVKMASKLLDFAFKPLLNTGV